MIKIGHFDSECDLSRNRKHLQKKPHESCQNGLCLDCYALLSINNNWMKRIKVFTRLTVVAIFFRNQDSSIRLLQILYWRHVYIICLCHTISWYCIFVCVVWCPCEKLTEHFAVVLCQVLFYFDVCFHFSGKWDILFYPYPFVSCTNTR